jgi:hypothetical protein
MQKLIVRILFTSGLLISWSFNLAIAGAESKKVKVTFKGLEVKDFEFDSKYSTISYFAQNKYLPGCGSQGGGVLYPIWARVADSEILSPSISSQPSGKLIEFDFSKSQLSSGYCNYEAYRIGLNFDLDVRIDSSQGHWSYRVDIVGDPQDNNPSYAKGGHCLRSGERELTCVINRNKVLEDLEVEQGGWVYLGVKDFGVTDLNDLIDSGLDIVLEVK